MNLYLRLLWLLLRLPFLSTKHAPLEAARLNMRVLPNDLDLNFHLNNGRYLTMMDLGRIHLIAITGLLKPILKRGWMPMVGGIKIHFIRGLSPFDKFDLTTRLVYWDEKWIYLEQQFLKNDVLCATALVKGLFVNKKEKIPPQTLFDLLPHAPASPAIPEAVKLWQEAEKSRN